MEPINLILDVLLILISVWLVRIATGYGGLIGKALNTIGWGAVVMGAAHLIETLMSKWMNISNPLVEFTHRLIILLGFILIVKGFKMFVDDNRTKDN
ncbi:MAG: hypothetical protein WC835_03605 [Candidatus Paceibacterota bacterium]|jgi:hypothetical protein